MPDVFLSYSRDDQAIARRFAEELGRAGFTVWWDQTLSPGEAYDEVTEKALQEAKAVVVLWSKKSVASRWVRAEATQAQRRNTLVPAMIEDCARPIMFDLTHTTDLSNWSGDANDKVWQSFLAGIRRFVEPGNAVESAPAAAARPRYASQWMVGIPVALLLVAGIAIWMINNRESGQVSSMASVAASPGTTATPISGITLAVLPFVDMSQARDHEYFSDGLTEELLNQLAQIKGLRVTARTSSFSFKGKNEDMRVIGEKLGVANILEGSVRKEGNQLRITAQLINSKDGAHLWSKTYDRELSAVFALQEEVAKDVAKALSITLDVGDLPRVQGGTTNVGAYDKYLLARELYLQGGGVQARQAAQQLREAVALDPQFSRAWLLLAYALPETLVGIPANQTASIQEELSLATERVLALAPDTWWALVLRGNQLRQQRKWAEAEAALNAAKLAAAENSAEFVLDGSYGIFLSAVGRIREFNVLLEQARQLNPLSLVLSIESQIGLDVAGQSAQAAVEYERSKGLAGTQQRGNVFAIMRELRRKEATPASIDAAFRTLLRSEILVMPLTRELAGTFRDPEKTRAALRQAIDDPRNQDPVRMAVTAMYADVFNETDLALTALRRSAIDFRATAVVWLPYRSELRVDPRYKQILKELGLAAYFRASGNWGDFCKPVGAEDFECH